MRAICQVRVPKARTQRTAPLALTQGLRRCAAEMRILPCAIGAVVQAKKCLPLRRRVLTDAKAKRTAVAFSGTRTRANCLEGNYDTLSPRMLALFLMKA